jgi:hypothetical protein
LPEAHLYGYFSPSILSLQETDREAMIFFKKILIANGTIATNIVYGNETVVPAFQTLSSLIIGFFILFAVVKNNWKDFK